MTKLVEKDSLHTIEEDNIQAPPSYHEKGPPQILTADTARQAPRGKPVLYVLVAALVAIGVAWIVVERLIY
jgi:hypothetical protein